MKAIMRCLSVAREDVVPLAPQLIGYFNTALDLVCRNPRNPLFNHYLFESTAVLVGSACSANPALTEQFESLLFPPFQHVLAQVCDVNTRVGVKVKKFLFFGSVFFSFS